MISYWLGLQYILRWSTSCYVFVHRVALTADVSKMYRAIELTPEDRDLHRFVWRQSTEQLLQDFRMTRLTLGV